MQYIMNMQQGDLDNMYNCMHCPEKQRLKFSQTYKQYNCFQSNNSEIKVHKIDPVTVIKVKAV